MYHKVFAKHDVFFSSIKWSGRSRKLLYMILQSASWTQKLRDSSTIWVPTRAQAVVIFDSPRCFNCNRMLQACVAVRAGINMYCIWNYLIYWGSPPETWHVKELRSRSNPLFEYHKTCHGMSSIAARELATWLSVHYPLKVLYTCGKHVTDKHA